MTKKLKNIPLKTFRKYLEYNGMKLIRSKGGHETWSRADLLRPVILQTHIDPIPEFIVRNCLRTIGVKAEDFYSWSEKK
jgi:predicted RNA binding protein YcfA (HicA-like mRNA interferase family)